MKFENIHNFYEQLVRKTIDNFSLQIDEKNDIDFLEDIACCALNRLPAKYVRHEVDLMFYMTSVERESIDASIHSAVMYSIEYVRAHRSTHYTEDKISSPSKKVKTKR